MSPAPFMLRYIKYALCLLVLFFAFKTVKVLLWDIPSLRWDNPTYTHMMDEKGGGAKQSWIPLNEISPALRRAVIAAEDGRFYSHNGIDYEEMKHAFKKNMKEKRYARGGSTITMQLAKNLYFSSRKSILRKLLEIPVAMKMERDLPKDRILELYLNLIEWGKGVYGAEEAARHYFKKSASRLSPREAAFLAAIIPNPVKWGRWPPGPYINKRIGIILRRTGKVPSQNGERPVFEDQPLPAPDREDAEDSAKVQPSADSGGDPTLPEDSEPEAEPIPDSYFLDDLNH